LIVIVSINLLLQLLNLSTKRCMLPLYFKRITVSFCIRRATKKGHCDYLFPNIMVILVAIKKHRELLEGSQPPSVKQDDDHW